MKIHKNIEQGTQQWHELRLGRITGSQVHKFLSPKTFQVTKACKEENIYDLIGKARVDYDENDKLEFGKIPTFVSERGYAGEVEVRAWYQETKLDVIESVSFIESDCGNFGFSPDGVVKNGFIEVKTVNSAFIMKAWHHGNVESYLYDKKPDYWLQILLGFFINPEFEFCDFIMYCGSLRETKERFFIQRFERPADMLKEFEKGLMDVIKLKQTILTEIRIGENMLSFSESKKF
jgi:hypothetical protein